LVLVMSAVQPSPVTVIVPSTFPDVTANGDGFQEGSCNDDPHQSHAQQCRLTSRLSLDCGRCTAQLMRDSLDSAGKFHGHGCSNPRPGRCVNLRNLCGCGRQNGSITGQSFSES
jgi:hypothetical protein